MILNEGGSYVEQLDEEIADIKAEYRKIMFYKRKSAVVARNVRRSHIRSGKGFRQRGLFSLPLKYTVAAALKKTSKAKINEPIDSFDFQEAIKATSEEGSVPEEDPVNSDTEFNSSDFDESVELDSEHSMSS